MKDTRVKNYWDILGAGYSRFWATPAQKALSERELKFVSQFLRISDQKTVLDIGIGTGRVLRVLINETQPETQIFGIDISERMVGICQRKFDKNKKIKELNVCDISELKGTFDFITAIRVLKYNKAWPQMIADVYAKLNKRGIFVFTMLNSYSLNRFSRGSLPVYRTTKGELETLLKETGYEILAIEGLARIPDFIYSLPGGALYTRTLFLMEDRLRFIFGRIFLSRILLIAALKN